MRSVCPQKVFATQPIKVPTGVRVTPKATQFWQPLRDALIQMRQTLEPIEFTPATATVTFTIAMNDFTAHLILPKLVTVVEKTAPGVDLRTIPTTYIINAPMLLEQAEIDLVIGVFPNPGLRLRSHSLFTSLFVCVMRSESTGLIDPILQDMGLKRRIALTVNQFAVAPRIIAQSD